MVGFDGSMSSERALAYAIGMAHRHGSGLIIVHVANRLPTTVWAGCEPPVFVDVPDHRTEVLGLELACADYLAEVPWILVERGGDICHELEEVGREYEADAIVVGSHARPGGPDLRLGGRPARAPRRSARSSSSPELRRKAPDAQSGAFRRARPSAGRAVPGYSTVTDFARLRGLSMSRPRASAVW